MAVTVSDIIAIMKEAGINPEIVSGLKLDVPLFRQGLDSIDLPVIAVATEKKYGVDLSDADAAKLKTINEFVLFLNQKLK
jgi:acyl carrier protein